MAKKMGAGSEDQLLRELLSGFSVKAAQVWLQTKFDSYDPAAGVEELRYVGSTLTKDEKLYFTRVQTAGFIKELPSKDGLRKPLVVAVVEMARELTDRTSRAKQFALAKKIIGEAFKTSLPGIGGKGVGLCTQGLFFFHDADGNFRLSLVTCGLKGRRLVSTTAKRQSFFCRPAAHNNIVKRQLDPDIKSFEDLQKAFSVEGITKEFYSKLFAWYQWACDKKTGVTFPNKIHDLKDDRDKLPEAVIRLITRLMFVWFVRQKGLIPDDLFRRDRVTELLNDDFKPDSANDGTYYRAILQNLFFATLNCPAEDRRFVQSGDDAKPNAWARSDFRCTTKYRYKEAFRPGKVNAFLDLMRQVPFLNCALFDCLDRRFDKDLDADEIERNGGEWEIFTDGFSRRGAKGKSPSYQAFVPNILFFYDKPNDAGREGIISLFDQYEFTVDENTADDSDVALDPELLGKVFENLLGAFNPETQEVARKSTGSFYTPREIVDYMTDESLKNYLKTKVPTLPEDHLVRLFDKNDETDAHVYLKPADLDAILDALYGCRILDPACGSGAFPMGLLHRMTQLFDRLDNNCTSIRRKIRERYETDKKFIAAADWMTEKERAERLADIEDQRQINLHHPDYTRKLFIIENCIYGVDIQPIATQISKLRFFISLLCDQLRNHAETDAKGRVTYRLLALPNLEAKFACANTLISLPKMDGLLNFDTPEITHLRKKLAAQRRRYFFARSYAAKKKAQADERQTRREIKAAVKKVISTPDRWEIEKQLKVLSRLEKDYEKVREPKWTTMKKPRQGDLFGGGLEQGELEFQRIDQNAEKRAQIASAMEKARQAIAAEKAKATQAQTGSAGDAYAEQVANWNPYDQNASSSFFDPDWMFGIKDGFDIVIGNPPYIQLQANSGELAKIYQVKGFETFDRMGDIYCLFYERGWQLLNDNGRVCYITSDKWMRNDYGRPFRRFLREKTDCQLLVDFAGQQLFNAATVETNILRFGKVCKGYCSPYVCSMTVVNGDVSTSISTKLAKCTYDSDEGWAILSPQEQGILKKVESLGRPIADCQVEINFGLKTGFNKAFLISSEERNRLVKESPTVKDVLHPVLRGRDICHFGYKWANLWLAFIPWHFPMHNDPQIEGASSRAEDLFMKQYGALYSFLKKYRRELSDRNKAEVGIRYEWYALQRWGANYWQNLTKPKIVWGEIADSPKFAYDVEGRFYCEATTFMMTGSELPLMYLYLNSKLCKYCFSKLGTTTGMGTLRWKKYKLEQLRVPKNYDKNVVGAYVDRILAAKKSDPNADTSALEAEIDQLVYKLYNLTPEEIAVVEGTDAKKEKGGGNGSHGKGKVKRATKPDDVPGETEDEEEYEELD
ncbi:MAG: Eco57I restriction-modification methylase domain-containing protein [bacterium]|nr:Eco57I restriction-modification methylase domain-containing protein [bacterium]